MVTSVTSMGRSGLYDWLMQRVTAVILLAYFLYIGCVLVSVREEGFWCRAADHSKIPKPRSERPSASEGRIP